MAIDFPNSPSNNDIYTVNGKRWIYSNGKWSIYGSTAPDATASDTEPTGVGDGHIWYRSDQSQTLIRYDNTWVEVGHSANIGNMLTDADTDTKIQVEESADEDTIRFDTAGVERFRLTNDGHIIPSNNETYDLGSSSNRFRDLYLSGSSIDLGGATISSDGTSLTMPPVSNISGDFTVDTDTLHVDSTNNRVGIGTDAPEHMLHLKSLGDAGIHIQGDSDNSGESDNPYISFSQDGSTAQQFIIGMNGGVDEAFTGAIANSPFIHAANAANQPLQLAHNGSVVMTLDSGNVGIGVTDPSSTLEIVSTDVETLYLRNSTNGGGTRIKWTDNASESQQGYLTYVHGDGQSYGHGNAFIFDSTEAAMTVVSTDDFTAVGTLTQNYSDERLKTIHGRIPNALEKLSGIRGYLYTQNETADLLGFKEVGVQQVGVSAQEVMAVLPQVVTVAPISYTDKTEEEYYTVRYERMIPLLIETIHELTARIEALEAG